MCITLMLGRLTFRTEHLECFSFFLPEIMETSDEQVNEAQPTQSVRQEKALCETPGTSRTSTRGSLRFGSLSHHSFFSRHNPHPHRVRHMPGLNGKPVCTVNDDWYGFTPLCPHPLIKSQVSGSRSSAFLTPEIGSDRSGPRAALISESWREELKDLATKVSLSAAAETQQDKREEVPRRKTQYSAQSGRIIPASSWGGKKRSRTSHKRAHAINELCFSQVLELLCQILQTDSLSMVQQWLLLASDRGLQNINSEFGNINLELQNVNLELRNKLIIVKYKLRIAKHKLRIAKCKLRIAK
uniref:Thymus, brain and testes associated n=1 Tax=Sinocyclocheilus grahami TaxID=75366 RepID=A0A672PQG3_SINGR